MSEKLEHSSIYEEDRVLELAVEMGQILLQSGAEIFRVEDTMRRVCNHFHVDSCNFFVMITEDTQRCQLACTLVDV
ncbi:MAG: threonine/serine exporter family protein, partial [Clostridia bacterium]|nr:threonine/serine exporter family protein [Clostridia bacterium]